MKRILYVLAPGLLAAVHAASAVPATCRLVTGLDASRPDNSRPQAWVAPVKDLPVIDGRADERIWEAGLQEFSRRSLKDKQYVYVWADGVYFNVRLEDEANRRQCILVLMGATSEGTKELIGLADGYRESEQSWRELLGDLKHRGLSIDPPGSLRSLHGPAFGIGSDAPNGDGSNH